eukprot:scaffold13905_cov119-Skeletonema_marinoi.AAC.6
MLDAIGFKSIHIYEESHCEFLAPWTTLIAFKDVETRKRWYRSSAEVELDLSRRILPTKDGKTSLRYFDGATMKSYQMPSRAFEDNYCRQQDKPEECAEKESDGFETDRTSSVQHATAFGHCAHHFAGEGLIDELVRPDKMVGGLFATSLRLVQVRASVH